jgi:hypothetical protein
MNSCHWNSSLPPPPLTGEGRGGGETGNLCHPPLDPLPSREGRPTYCTHDVFCTTSGTTPPARHDLPPVSSEKCGTRRALQRGGRGDLNGTSPVHDVMNRDGGRHRQDNERQEWKDGHEPGLDAFRHCDTSESSSPNAACSRNQNRMLNIEQGISNDEGSTRYASFDIRLRVCAVAASAEVHGHSIFCGSLFNFFANRREVSL